MNRIKLLDIAKGIGMVFVVLGHSNMPQYMTHFIYFFHMPLFFFLSGFAYARSSKKSFSFFLKGKFNSLLIPYLLFSILAYAVLGYANQLQDSPFIYLVKGSSVEPNLAIWFLAHLFVLQVLMYFIIQPGAEFKDIRLLLVIVCLFVIGLASSFFHFKAIFHIEILGLSSAFYLIGFFVADKVAGISDKFLMKGVLLWPLLIFSLLYLMLLTYFSIKESSDHVDLNSNYIGSPFFFLTGSLIGIIFSFLLSSLLLKNVFLKKIIEFIGKNSLIILCVHQLIPVGLKQFYLDINVLVNPFFHKIIVMGFIGLFIFIFNNYFFFFMGRQKKLVN